jgi:hypothetical protein
LYSSGQGKLNPGMLLKPNINFAESKNTEKATGKGQKLGTDAKQFQKYAYQKFIHGE